MTTLDHPSPTVGVIGTGVMAEAVLAGLLRNELTPADRVVCSHPRSERRAELSDRYGVGTTADNTEAAAADVVILGVKPQMLEKVLPELRGCIAADSVVLSVIAGATTAVLTKGLAHEFVVRSMPNTPSQIGMGVTVWYAAPTVDDRHRALAKAIFAGLGIEIEVSDENDVAKATAVSGTGPTYVFLFLEAMIDAAVHLGFPRHVAREIVLDTVRGSTEFALQSGHHAAHLRDMVTSPGGTSAAALYELEKGRLRTVLSDAVWAAYHRTEQLERRLESE